MPNLDDFYKNYNRPQIDSIIVGFSGIDPLPKSVDAVHMSEIDRDMAAIEASQKPDHEELKGLQGGDEGQHYHLTVAEYDKFSDYPDYEVLQSFQKHNNLIDIQGGSDNDGGYYIHLSDTEYDRLQKVFSILYKDNQDNTEPELLTTSQINALIQKTIDDNHSDIIDCGEIVINKNTP